MSASFSINFNPAANSVLSNLTQVGNAVQQDSEVMSTGNSVNSAADNPADYAMSQNMIMNSNGLNVAAQNAQQGVSMIQTATGAQQQSLGILQTMNQLATQAAQSGTQTVSDRAGLQLEMNSLAQEINSIANQTQYNGLNILSGQFSNATGAQTVTLQVGADQGQTISFNIAGTDANSLGVAGVAADTVGSYTSGSATASANLTAPAGADLATNGTSGISLVSGSILETGTFQVVFNGNYQAGSGTTTANMSSGTLQLQMEGADGTYEDIGNAINITSGTTAVTLGDSASGAAINFTFNSATFGTATVAASGDSGTLSQTDSFTLTGTATSSGSASNSWTSSTNVVGLNILTQSNAAQSLTSIQSAISTLTDQEEQLGAVQNRLTNTVSDLNNTSSNLQTANNVIVGANMAQAESKFSQDQILEQAGISVLSQVNQQPSMVLKLLGA
ncbi:flagellin [Alicyclobacillus fodiniaquatilis]|uniref:Flagellin n=1 Tax=Alicyclobacillus fodiniaquatilis TaxID=1661150 RepID=A0ABW4JT53_9BACL